MTARRLLAVLGAVVAVLAGPATAAAAPPPAPSGTWSWPLAGPPVVTRWFEPPPGPYAAGHRGVDLAGADGAPVLSAADGVVAFAGMVAGRPVVSVDHPGGLRTTYEPVRAGVAAGRAVTRGAPLGVLLPGHAGCPAAACLHWGLRRAGTYLDPLSRLSPPRVRLLPWGDGRRVEARARQQRRGPASPPVGSDAGPRRTARLSGCAGRDGSAVGVHRLAAVEGAVVVTLDLLGEQG
ncbi:murein hydrolase activator EnvC family protein [Modestobacter marinus]|uniref:murein hydrolase activator EnvC family protein n=1 Tax=Modestobacter marinus TaxID=477641 RepID=UPI001C97BFBF|nr:M23 family metallopeptidase [Modestobacter marinus]